MSTTYYQTDKDGIFTHPVSSDLAQPYGAIETPPPAAVQGKVARWVTDTPRHSADYGKATTGSWSSDDDNRNTTLYQTQDGQVYQAGTSTSLGSYSGVGTLPDWLTTTSRPDSYYTWTNGAWTVDQAAKLTADKAFERAWRDGEINSITWIRDRHRDQVEAGHATTLTADQFTQLLTYLQALRDWPESTSFPTTTARPVAPTWLASEQPS